VNVLFSAARALWCSLNNSTSSVSASGASIGPFDDCDPLLGVLTGVSASLTFSSIYAGMSRTTSVNLSELIS
jgi:hypothetical protein